MKLNKKDFTFEEEQPSQKKIKTFREIMGSPAEHEDADDVFFVPSHLKKLPISLYKTESLLWRFWEVKRSFLSLLALVLPVLWLQLAGLPTECSIRWWSSCP